jgi:hypothetical protein
MKKSDFVRKIRKIRKSAFLPEKKGHFGGFFVHIQPHLRESPENLRPKKSSKFPKTSDPPGSLLTRVCKSGIKKWSIGDFWAPPFFDFFRKVKKVVFICDFIEIYKKFHET